MNIKLTDNIKNKIREIYEDKNYNVKSVELGKRRKNGEKTGEISICVYVHRKKPLNELKKEEVLPRYFTIDGKDIRVDVIEQKEDFTALACWNHNIVQDTQGNDKFAPNDPEIFRLQGDPQLLTPVKGGQQIGQFPTSFQANGASSVGTLGFMGVDPIDNKIVGVTNNHVACKKGTFTSDRDSINEFSDPYNIIEPIEWILDNNLYPPGGVFTDFSQTGLNFWVHGATNIKRYIPYLENGINYVDVALLIMEPSHIDNDSYQIHTPTTEPDYTPHYPFATTAEIDDLMNNPRTIFSTGRTTGPKGWGSDPSCILEITGLAQNAMVNGLSDSTLDFSDLISFEFNDGSQFPIAGGDSGSALIAEFDGVRKIIGLNFAGNTTRGLACRIDRVAEAIKLKAWDVNYVMDKTVSTAEVVISNIQNSDSSDTIIQPECEFLFQGGSTINDSFTDLNSIVPLSCPVTATPTPTPSVSDSATPTPTPSVSDSATPTPTPTPSISESATLSLTSISPTTGAENDTITATGTFDTSQSIAFTVGGTAATSPTVVDSTTATFVVPAGTGTVDVTVTQGSKSDTLAGAFEYTAVAAWTPADITTAIWLDAKDSATLTLDGSSNVEQWDDKSGNARHYSQATSTDRPGFESAGLNSQETVFFDTGEHLEGPDWASGDDHTFIGVFDPVGSGDRRYMFASGVDASSGSNDPLLLIAFRNNNQDVGYFDGTSWRGAAAGTTGAQILEWLLDGTAGTGEVFRDGASIDTPAYSANNIQQGTNLGARTGAANNWSLSRISELVKIDGVASQDDREKMEGYLAHKWGLEANLPAAHPYKSSPP